MFDSFQLRRESQKEELHASLIKMINNCIVGFLLILFPFLGHFEQFQIRLCRFIVRKQVVNDLFPSCIGAIFRIDLSSFVDLLGHKTVDVIDCFQIFLVQVVFKLFPCLQKNHTLQNQQTKESFYLFT